MAIERTLSIIKPDGVEKGIIGKIISRFETNGLKPVARMMVPTFTSRSSSFIEKSIAFGSHKVAHNWQSQQIAQSRQRPASSRACSLLSAPRTSSKPRR